MRLLFPGLLSALLVFGACADDPAAGRDDDDAPGDGDAAIDTPDAAVADADRPLRDARAEEDRVAPPPSADALLLDEIQRATFRYFWDFGHPVSGLARERGAPGEAGDLTTSGGTGFGVHAIVVAASRGFVTRAEARARLQKMVTFLATADRFHGAWSHWLSGATGKTIPFSDDDNGGDLVETSFLIHGLLTAREYFDGQDAAETTLRQGITELWESVDWAFYASRGDGKLYWHWSPNKAWAMNLPIRGYDEALVTHVLALGSPTHPIPQAVYDSTWTHAGYENNDTFLGYQLPLGPDYGGPLFFEHYSHMALDPRKMADSHASYWYQSVVHTRINRAWCIDGANLAFGYGSNLWGLTASDNPDGYDAHSPTNDNGTIAPTAALASMPYTPHESLEVARYLRSLGSQAFGDFGFVDALNPSRGWYDRQSIAIDQGPIITMIENYRTGLLWSLFMRIPQVQLGLSRARIAEPDHATGFYLAVPDLADGRVHLVRHPDRGAYELDVAIHDAGAYSLVVETAAGVDVNVIWNEEQLAKGQRVVALGQLPPGSYVAQLSGGGVTRSLPFEAH